MSLFNPTVTGILGVVSGVALTLITKFGEGWIREYFERRKERQDEKKQAAKELRQ